MSVVQKLSVGKAELKVVAGEAVLTCAGLGSCVVVVAHEPNSCLTGLAQIALPTAFVNKVNVRQTQFADTAIPLLIEELIEQGAEKERLIVAVVGGSQPLNSDEKTDSILDLGRRNTLAVIEALTNLGITVNAVNVGGHDNKTLTVDTSKGTVAVTSSRSGTTVLLNLLAQTEGAAA